MSKTHRDSLAEADVFNAETARLNKLAGLFEAEGSYARAAPLYERALRICETALGTDHPNVATALSNLARLHRAQGAYRPAALLLERALRIRETALGAEHPDVATTLANLAVLYRDQGAYAHAGPLFERALRIFETALASEHPDVAAVLNNLAGLYRAQGRYAQAEALYTRALCGFETTLGIDHPHVATVLHDLAGLYQVQGAYAQAEPLYDRALRIYETALGPEHPHVAMALNNLARLHRAQGAYAQAEALYTRGLRILEAGLGAEHPEVATVLSDLAMLCQQRGVYTQAEPLHERALRIYETALGAEHPHVATALNNLAMLYREQGAYAQAEPLCERALRIRETVLGAEHPDVATALNNLGALYQDQGRHAQAQLLYERALRLYEKALGAEHPRVATALNNLALLHHGQGAYAQAGQLYECALRILEMALGPEHPDVATGLHNLARLYQDQGVHAQAGPLFERALSIRETALGPEHPEVAEALNSLARFWWSVGDASKALRYFMRAGDVWERHLGITLAALTEKRKRQLLQTMFVEAEVLVSFHAHVAPDNVEALALTLTTILRRKGRVLAEVASQQAAMRRNLAPALRTELDTLQAYRTVTPLRLESVQTALPIDATLVEFVRYRRYDPNRAGQEQREALYIAYILRHDGLPQWVALGDAEPIEAAVSAARSALTRPGNDARDHLRILDELVFAPVRRRLRSTQHFVLSPDSALHLVPFAALVDENGEYLVEHKLISYVTSGRDLVRSYAGDLARSKPLVVAAPAYEGRCPPLPGAEAEAGAVRKHFADVDVHIGSQATKDKLTGAQGPLFVHVATHGLFRPSRVAASSRIARSWRDERDVSINVSPSLPALLDNRPDIEGALDDAVLIFAGASDAAATLTAREIANIDLRGTQLIVLSACDTGIGEVDQSEGIYGLRRALAIAGAQTQLVSLWKIDDIATGQLMDRYYGNLRRQVGRAEALRHAQMDMMRDGQHAHPFYWAAFVSIGDEKPLRE